MKQQQKLYYRSTASTKTADRNIDIMTSNSGCEACRDFFSPLFHSILLVEYIMKTNFWFVSIAQPHFIIFCVYQNLPALPGGRVLTREAQNKISLNREYGFHSPFFFFRRTWLPSLEVVLSPSPLLMPGLMSPPGSGEWAVGRTMTWGGPPVLPPTSL